MYDIVDYDRILEHIELTKLEHMAAPFELWEAFPYDKFLFTKDENLWHNFKFLNADGSLNERDIRKVNTKKGGVYVFYVNPNIVPNVHRYLMYVGEAIYTNNENLRTRLRSYYNKYVVRNEIGRPKIDKLFLRWKKYIHVQYIQLDNNNIILELESALIRSIVPPCNDKIPDEIIRKAVTAAFGG